MAKTVTKAKKAKKKTGGTEVNFNKLTATQKRVAIAEDVIAALKAKRYIATEGTYCRSSVTVKGLVDKKELEDEGSVEVSVQDALKNMKSCEVCAKGAMFVASVEKFNKLNIEVRYEDDGVLEEFNGDGEICDHLGNYFNQDQLDLIECAFEGSDFIESNGIDESQEKWAAIGYEYKYSKPEDRMIAIMENVIRNKGRFVCTPKELFN